MIDIVARLGFDAIMCEAEFSKGVASNIEAGIKEIERLRTVRDALMDVINVYDWCNVDPVDRGYSSLDSVIHDARKLVYP